MKANAKQAPMVINNTEKTPELLATEILAVGDSAKRLLASRLTKRAILVLMRDLCGGLPLATIEVVLDQAANLGSFVKR